MRQFGTRIPLTGPFALVVGMICIGVAVYTFMTSSSLLTDGVVTQAKVVGVDSRLSDGRRSYALTLAFKDREGVTHRERTGYRKRHRWTRTGEEVQIRYNPRRPSEFVFDTWLGLWMMPIGFLVVGIAGCAGFLVGPSRRERFAT